MGTQTYFPGKVASTGETALVLNKSNNNLNMVWASIALAAGFWFFEPVSYSILLDDGTFIQHWLQPDQDRVEMRTVIVALLLLFGIYAQIMLGRQKQAYLQLKNNTQLLRKIVDNAHDAFFSIDATGKIIDWNPAAENMFGWSRQHAIGQNITETIISPEHRQTFSSELKSFSESGQTKLLNTRSEASLWHRDGF
ncbi:MAG: PAS domain-containing protein, partial [Mariprofundus sp.]|nr:PAS domain-containing protein [Mariprofundus sp.]